MTPMDNPWLDSDIEAREEAIRLHPAKGFKFPYYTAACPGCGRKVRPMMLEVPHWRPNGKAVCSSCRARDAKWYVSPTQRAASLRAKEKRRELGVKPNPGGFPVE